MIYGTSGRPRSGKTYEVVTQHIIPALKDGRKIITNIPLNVEWFVDVLGAQVRDLIVLIDGKYHEFGKARPFSTADDFLKYDTWRNDKNQGVYFFIDECHLAMPKGRTNNELKEYLSMHGHYGHDIMLLTQNFRKVDIDVRDMVEVCYHTTKLSMLGKDTEYVLKVSEGVSRNFVNQTHKVYESKYFGAYKSHTKSDGSVIEQATKGTLKWYQRKTTIGSAALIVFGFFIIGGNLARDKDDKQQIAAEKISNLTSKPEQQQPPIATPQPVQQVKQPPPEPPKSSKHPFEGVQIHLSGWYADNDYRGRYSKKYYFAISRNGQLLSELTHVDMQLAGYTVKIYNACAAEISYDDYHAFVLCDTPTQSVQPAGEQLVASN